MKRGLSYIVMAVFCGLCFSSCAKDELAAKAGGDGRAPVRLALSLSGNSSRTVDAPTADGNWGFYHSGTGDYCGRRCVCTSD